MIQKLCSAALLVAVLAHGANALSTPNDYLYAAKVVDLETNEVVYQKHESIPMRPASTLKLLTFYLGVKELGADYTFKTVAYKSGNDLYIKFSGDPMLTKAELEELIVQAKASGTHYHNVYLDGDEFGKEWYAPGWAIGGARFDYSAPISQFMIDRNSVTLKRIGEAGLKYREDGRYQSIALHNAATKTEKPDVCPLELIATGVNQYTLEGCYHKDQIPPKLSTAITDPNANAIGLVKAMLVSNGMSASNVKLGKMPKGAKVVAEHESISLDKIMTEMLVHSDNQIAEVIAKTLALKSYNMPATWYRTNKFYKDKVVEIFGAEGNSVNFGDGSGLSNQNLMSVNFMESLVNKIYADPKMRELYFKSVPTPTMDKGTLSRSFKESRLRPGIFAKTGTLYSTVSLAGVYKSQNGKDYSFAFISDNLVMPIPAARELEEKLLEEILP